MKTSLLTKYLSTNLVAFIIHLIPLLQIKSLASDTTSLSLVNAVNGASNETDFHALLAFKSNILPVYQQALSSWNESLHFCHWEGIKCGRKHERVTVIDLTSRGLMGSLSPRIGNLSFLRELRLANNTFIGEIPTELGSLFRLQNLNLSFNGFEGKIPPSLSRCSKLRYLDMGHNKLVGEFPKQLAYSMLRFLTVLYVYENNLTGAIPPWVGNLTYLNAFGASSNQFGGSIPNSLGQLKNLTFLSLEDNQISGTIPHSLYNLSSLVKLSLADNRLQGTLLPTLGFMFPNLEVFKLSQNQFNGPLPLSMSNSSQLASLELSDNNFNGKVRIDFGNLQYLNWINLSNNNFETKGPDGLAFLSSLTNCSDLEVVILENSQFGGILPDSVSNLTSVSRLALGGNQLHGSIPSTIGSLVNLQELALNLNLITGPIPGSIGFLHKLQRLDLAVNSISGKIPDSIGNLSFLIDLYLGGNKLEGPIPSNLGNCRKLLMLSLSGNNLNGSIPRQLLMVSSLSIGLDMFGNRLSGSLPLEVGNLVNLALLDISGNDLSGEIPSTLGSCRSLEILYLDHNSFQGSIPSSMEPLRGIQELDLSHNNLSGNIPRFLGTFNLENLNLSFNNFEGELPMDGVFKNQSVISITGNYRLCGGILELKLPRCTTKRTRNRKFLSRTLGITIVSVLVGVTIMSFFIIYLSKKKRKTKPTVPLLNDPFLKVSYGELLKATEGFSSTNLLGFGSFSRVYKGVIEQNGGLVVAVKVLDLQTRGAAKSFMAECEALRNIRHRNLVSIITSCSSMDFQGNEFKALIYEFMPNGSLDNWLHPNLNATHYGGHEFVELNLLQRIDIAIDVACALDYLHHRCERPIIHCDLKPSNILLDGDMVAHVGDFGLARFHAEFTPPNASSSTTTRGTIGYVAPEYGLGSEMSTCGDVYSYGILLLEIITRKRPTDEMFMGDLTLLNFARIALPQRAMEIIDPMLLTEERNGYKMMGYLISIIEIGLACSKESPKDRMSIDIVLRELHLVKNNILKGNMGG